MPGLKTTISAYDLDFLTRIARAWRIEVSTRDVSGAAAGLLTGMLEPGNLDGVLSRLDDSCMQAWQELLSRGGHIPWASFSRKYGAIRSIGPARRERENPDLNPESVSETLWYAGLVGKAFLKISAEPEEYIYIPDELNKGTMTESNAITIVIRAAVGQEPRHVRRADSSILDHLTDMLSSARMEQPVPDTVFNSWGMTSGFLHEILRSSALMNPTGQPDAELLKTFFQKTRSQNLLSLFQTWLKSRTCNDLRMLPGLAFEGAWQNDPLIPRRLLRDVFLELKGEPWWSISSLLASVKEHTPDFQRSAGDYDSWFIREEGTDHYLRGFEAWEQVEGTLIQYLLTGPFHWLGLINLAYGPDNKRATAFQLTPAGMEMLEGNEPKINNSENQEIVVKGVSTLVIPGHCSRLQRYQAARFCEFASASPLESIYRITPASLKRAAVQGLNMTQLVQLLTKDRVKPLPVGFMKMAERWQVNGLEAEIKTVLLLHFMDEGSCTRVLSDPGASRVKMDRLNPTTVLIQREQLGAVQKLLAELGILVQIGTDV